MWSWPSAVTLLRPILADRLDISLDVDIEAVHYYSTAEEG